MKRFLVVLLAVVGGLAILTLALVFLVTLVAVLGKETVADHTILELDFERPLVEHVPEDPFAMAMLDDALPIRDVVDALEAGADDERVVGLVARLGSARLGLAQVQEIRGAVGRFRESGKKAVAFAESFGEFGPGNGSYYLATAFDAIYVQPSGDVGLTGLMYQTMFRKGTYDKLGIEAQVDQRYEYKNAANSHTRTEYTEQHREAMQTLMDSQFSQIVSGIADARGKTEDEVRELFDRGPYLGQEALEAELIDGLAYRDEVLELVRADLPDDSELLYVDHYLERAGRPHERGETIALVYGVGGVVRGKSGFDPFVGTFSMGSDTVSAALRSAIDDPSVEAIVFRVDSPGGSYIASDSIWRETVRAREVGKPVVVSMGNVAASGGYFVSMSAEKIVALPGTITASIGVFGGKLVTAGLMEKLGLSFDEVHTSRNSRMWSSQSEFTPSEKARLDAYLDRVYDDFTSKVARWRDLDPERVGDVARGRIWTGEDALELGLIDALGGLPEAVELAKEAAGILDDEPIRIKIFPRPKTIWEALFDEGSASSEERTAAALSVAVERLQPAFRALRGLGVDRPTGALTMPEIEAQH